MPFPFFNRQSSSSQPQRTGMQRILGMGLGMINPLLGMGYRSYTNNLNAMNSVLGSGSTATGGMPNLGFGNSQPSMPNQQGAQPLQQPPSPDIAALIASGAMGAGGAMSAMRPQPQGAGFVTAANPYGAYRTADETAAQRDSRYATEANFVAMRDGTNEAINANQLMAAVRGRMT